MKLLLALLPFLSGLSSADGISAATLTRIADDKDTGCNQSEMDDCLEIDSTGYYFTASVSLTSAYEVAAAGTDNMPSCCYEYELIHDVNVTTCEASGTKNSALSHLDMDYVCDDVTGVTVTDGSVTCVDATGADCGPDGTGAGFESDADPDALPTDATDGSTCYIGLKWDVGMIEVDGAQSLQNVYTYKVCLTWNGFTVGGGCQTASSWVMVKAGKTFDFEEGAVASCTQSDTTPEPTTAEPTTAEPTTAEPTTSEPTTSEPTTSEPTTSEPTTSEPTTSEPTTSEPTTSEPTTSEPTTAEPTTAEPTTSEPTTAEPTTSEPTTAEPTTAEPTTAEPTTSEPTVTTGTCVEIGARFSSSPHVCVCVPNDALPVSGECGPDESEYYCKSVGFVASRLSEGDVGDGGCTDGVCCCHCPVCSAILLQDL